MKFQLSSSDTNVKVIYAELHIAMLQSAKCALMQLTAGIQKPKGVFGNISPTMFMFNFAWKSRLFVVDAADPSEAVDRVDRVETVPANDGVGCSAHFDSPPKGARILAGNPSNLQDGVYRLTRSKAVQPHRMRYWQLISWIINTVIARITSVLKWKTSVYLPSLVDLSYGCVAVFTCLFALPLARRVKPQVGWVCSKNCWKTPHHVIDFMPSFLLITKNCLRFQPGDSCMVALFASLVNETSSQRFVNLSHLFDLERYLAKSCSRRQYTCLWRDN